MDKDIIISGVHLQLTDAIKQIVHEKVEKLFRHDEHIIRIRVDLMHETTKDPSEAFIAKGHIEIHSPDIIATATSDDLYKSIDLLIQKLDRQLNEHFKK
ncbi:MAG: ribosome-associated translation inhibitor RaiA [Puniceicoccales bacterium]|jgi:putative sigma-54 modulation protein|nr:ribosome-associated translation inhibitor RaiA [Puniceicoccales bacterium]